MRGVRPDTAVYNEHGQRLCEYKGCNRLHSGHGLCVSHNQQLKRKGALSPLPKHDHKECSHDGCVKWVLARGLCHDHHVDTFRPAYKERKRNEVLALKAQKSKMENRIKELENQVKALQQLIKEDDGMTNTTENIRQIEIIDLKVGMVYRPFRTGQWSTAETIRYSRHEYGRIGVTVTNVEGGGMSTGSGDLVYIKEEN
jgi:hypothetical protein